MFLLFLRNKNKKVNLEDFGYCFSFFYIIFLLYCGDLKFRIFYLSRLNKYWSSFILLSHFSWILYCWNNFYFLTFTQLKYKKISICRLKHHLSAKLYPCCMWILQFYFRLNSPQSGGGIVSNNSWLDLVGKERKNRFMILKILYIKYSAEVFLRDLFFWLLISFTCQ